MSASQNLEHPNPLANPTEALEQAFATAKREAQGEKLGAQDYRVSTPVFDGPLDLLLHLIRKEQINIYDIPISKICRSYLAYVETMTVPDVNLAGEFMVMAATLMFMKSLMLLPREESAEAEDPRAPLVAALLDYERFKKAAAKLDEMDWLFRDIYPRPFMPGNDIVPVEALMDAPIEPIDTFQLLLCLKAALSRTDRPPLKIATDPISIREKVVQIGEVLESGDTIEFRTLLPEDPRPKDIILAFFASLELARLKFIEVLQHENFGPIYLRSVRSIRELNVGLLDQF